MPFSRVDVGTCEQSHCGALAAFPSTAAPRIGNRTHRRARSARQFILVQIINIGPSIKHKHSKLRKKSPGGREQRRSQEPARLWSPENGGAGIYGGNKCFVCSGRQVHVNRPSRAALETFDPGEYVRRFRSRWEISDSPAQCTSPQPAEPSAPIDGL